MYSLINFMRSLGTLRLNAFVRNGLANSPFSLFNCMSFLMFIILIIAGRRCRGAHSQMYPGMSSTVAARTLAICKAVRAWFSYAR